MNRPNLSTDDDRFGATRMSATSLQVPQSRCGSSRLQGCSNGGMLKYILANDNWQF